MIDAESKRLRTEGWIQFILLVIVLVGAVVSNERRLTRMETLIQTYEVRLNQVERTLSRHLQLFPKE